jgi:hypothetical protein
MGYTVQQTSAKVADQAMVANAWSIIRREVGSLPLDKQWTTAYHAKSLTVHSRRQGILIKVTIDGGVFYDRRLTDGNYRSEKLQAPDMAQACALARERILRHL